MLYILDILYIIYDTYTYTMINWNFTSLKRSISRAYIIIIIG